MDMNLSISVSKVFSMTTLGDVSIPKELECPEEMEAKCLFPEFGAHLLQRTALTKICGELRMRARNALAAVNDVPSVIVTNRMCSLWEGIVEAHEMDLDQTCNEKNNLKEPERSEERLEANASSSTVTAAPHAVQAPVPDTKRTGGDLLVEVGVKMGLSVVFTLLRQQWSQLAWQKQVEQALLHSASPSPAPIPAGNAPNEILKSVLGVLTSVPPLSLSNTKTISLLSQTCLTQSIEFLQWVISPTSQVNAEGKRLALQITISLYLQRGSLVLLLEWVEGVLQLLVSYRTAGMDVHVLALDVDYCQGVLREVRKRTVSGQRGVKV